MVRIHLLEAQNLAAKDNYVKGVMAGLSDPYAILRVGPQTFTSKHVDNTDSPKWEEIYEVWRTERFMDSLKFVSSIHRRWKTQSYIISLCSIFKGLDSYSTGNVHFHAWSHEAAASFHTNPSVSLHILVCVWCIRL